MTLATRVIPVVLFRGHEVVKGQRFDSWRSVGHVRQAVRIHQMRNVDELVLLNVSRQPFDLDLVRDLCSDCFMPVTVGGGIRTIDDFRALLANGADKVAVNTAAVETPELIAKAANRFGSQSVVVSIDVKDGQVTVRCGTESTGLEPVAWAREVERLGAGEILLGSVERDGVMQGYDVDLIERVARAVRIPVVAVGGCGTYEHMAEVLEHTEAHAVAAGAMFAFTQATPRGACAYLAEKGFPMRLAA